MLESGFSEGVRRDQDSTLHCIATDIDELDSDYEEEELQLENPADNQTDATSSEDGLPRNKQYKVIKITDTA